MERRTDYSWAGAERREHHWVGGDLLETGGLDPAFWVKGVGVGAPEGRIALCEKREEQDGGAAWHVEGLVLRGAW